MRGIQTAGTLPVLLVKPSRRSRTTVMQLSNISGRKLVAFTMEEYEGLLNIAEDIRKEFVLLEKRL
jgi:hypothetical protein